MDKFCKDCKYAKQGKHSQGWDGYAECWRKPRFNVVSGELIAVGYCDIQRMNGGDNCGPEAKFFETNSSAPAA